MVLLAAFASAFGLQRVYPDSNPWDVLAAVVAGVDLGVDITLLFHMHANGLMHLFAVGCAVLILSFMVNLFLLRCGPALRYSMKYQDSANGPQNTLEPVPRLDLCV